MYKGREISAKPLSGYGRYELSAKFYNREITCITNESEVYDWLSDDSDKRKHAEAKQVALMLLQRAAKEYRENR